MMEYMQGEESASIEVDERDWRFPIIQILIDKQASLMDKRRYTKYAIIGDDLYKRSPSEVFLKCLILEQGQRLVKEVHGGLCENHAAADTLMRRVLRSGF